MKKKLIGVIIFTMVVSCMIIGGIIQNKPDYQSTAAAYTSMNTAYIYLTNPMMVSMPNGAIKMVRRIEIYSHNYKIINDVIYATPISQLIYGEEIIIPLYNVRAIVKGANKFKEHFIERE